MSVRQCRESKASSGLLCSAEQNGRRTHGLQAQPPMSFSLFIIFSHILLKESSLLTYMAVEQAAFVTRNSFRLLEVFNRHFKLKKEEACKKIVDKEGRGGKRVRGTEKEKGTEISRVYGGKKT